MPVFIDDRVEQLGLDSRIIGDRVGSALRRQGCIARGIEPGSALLDARHPRVEVGRRHGLDLEMLLRIAAAAVLAVAADEGAGLVGQHLQPGLHAGHGVDLAGELRHVERVHHRVGGDAQADRTARRKDQLVHHGDPLLRVDEKPLPVLRHDLDVERRFLRFQRTVGVEPVGAAPQQHRDGNDDDGRYQPGEGVDFDRIVPGRRVHRLGIGGPIPPSEP